MPTIRAHRTTALYTLATSTVRYPTPCACHHTGGFRLEPTEERCAIWAALRGPKELRGDVFGKVMAAVREACDGHAASISIDFRDGRIDAEVIVPHDIDIDCYGDVLRSRLTLLVHRAGVVELSADELAETERFAAHHESNGRAAGKAALAATKPYGEPA